MKKTSHPDPMVSAMSMAWDRDMQERMLQIMERMANAAELQATQQRGMAQSWETMTNQRQLEMNERIDTLLQALARKEDQLSAMISRPHRGGR
jgi:ribonuclease HI